MRENVICCDRFDFISILDLAIRKAAGEHATICVTGHVSNDSDDCIFQSAAGEKVVFTVSGPDGDRGLFNGLIVDIGISVEGKVRTLSVHAISHSSLMDIDLRTRTFQDAKMTYDTVTGCMSVDDRRFNYMWPAVGHMPIGSMSVQYQETDWQYCKRLAGRLGTVVIPDYMLDFPYVSIGMLKRPVKTGINAMSYTIGKDVDQYRINSISGGRFSERDSIYFIVKSREILDICDPVPFNGLTLYVYAIDTRYEGSELIHYYTLREEGGFYTKQTYNENLIGASLRGNVIEIKDDTVRVRITGDVNQSEYKWFPYATPFSQPDGNGWFFMPEIGDEIRLQFPTEKEDDAYVSSALHISHGDRTDPEVKFIRTVYGQNIRFDPEKILIDDGAGSRIALIKDEGISMDTNKNVVIDAKADITISASGKVLVAGQNGVVIQKNDSVISIDDAIDISSAHTRVQ